VKLHFTFIPCVAVSILIPIHI